MGSALWEALHADLPEAAVADQLQLYGQFVGAWSLQVEAKFIGGSHIHAEGEALFDWVLEGRAIQDVFIIPARDYRRGKPANWWRYGSTIRWYDPTIEAWHITFYDPARRVELRQIGRVIGDEIVQTGVDDAGLWRRWRFTEITTHSFLWLGEVSWDRGGSWTLELRMAARRDARRDTS